MCGPGDDERFALCRAILALRDGDAEAIVRAYRAIPPLGYHLRSDDPAVVARYATWHLDRLDLSPIATADGVKTVAEIVADAQHHETHVPPAVTNARRMSSLLLGVAVQTGTRVSLAETWAPIAERVLEDHGHRPRQRRHPAGPLRRLWRRLADASDSARDAATLLALLARADADE